MASKSENLKRRFCQESNCSHYKRVSVAFLLGSLWETKISGKERLWRWTGAFSAGLRGMQILYNPILSAHVTRLFHAKYFLNSMIVKVLPTHAAHCSALGWLHLPSLEHRQ